MNARIRDLIWIFLLAFVLVSAGCNCAQGVPLETESAPTTTTTTTEDLGPCGMDCSQIPTPSCTLAVCNEGQYVGPLYSCIVITADAGTPCDDGLFCTADDHCEGGACVGGETYDCGMKTSPCEAVVCYEDSQSCDVTPVNDGTACTPTDLCEVNGVCQLGECIGEPKDCSFSPLAECNTVGCDPADGKCVGVPDAKKDNIPCVLTGDLCAVNKTCKAGTCQGGSPKDCSDLDVGCQTGVCDPQSGICGGLPAPVGTLCTEGLHECDVGACDVKGTCVASPAPDGALCNDHNACTASDSCSSGTCGGSAIGGCKLYMLEGFENCDNEWTLGGDWQCGEPKNVGPLEAHTGQGVIATQVASVYHVSQSFNTAVATSPPIDLTTATSPVLSFWAWVHTEGGTFDGWNLKVSKDGGQTFVPLNTVTPAYNLTIAGQAAWGGNQAAESWQNYGADLSAFAGETIQLRIAFRSDGATVFPGVYIDDIVVSEPQESPIFITTDPKLENGYAGMIYTAQIEKTGGTPNSVWSLKPGGVNVDWLSIDPATGVLSGTPADGNAGMVSVTVHVEEPGLPSNYADQTFTFTINQAKFYASFEGACPAGWTLTGDWECGPPTGVGPVAAFVGTQCLGTNLEGNYSNLQTYANTTATSPAINLTGVVNPKLTFRMWIDTEGSTYDGFNLQISTDGGVNFNILDTANPSYTLTVAGKPAWGGHLANLDWQYVEADLAPYAGQSILLRFAFQSDSSGTFPGVYIDDILVN